MANDFIKTLQAYVLELSAEVKALKEEIDILSSGGFMPAGSVYFADLPSLIDERYGFVYNIKDDFITTSDFIEGAGKRYSAGTNVGIVKDDNNNLKYDTLASFVDTAAIYEAIGVKQNINLSEEIAGASTVEGALKAINQSAGITVDSEISSISTNPVQNKVIKGQLDLKLDTDGKANSATSADYATKAERDGHNNVISSTYATKTELSDGLSGKVDAVAGKGLSSNDYTNEDKDYVDGLPAQLLGKQDKYETITYAQWQAMTPAQKVEKDYYISNYPASVLTAGNISYDNTTSGMAADDTQEAIDELHDGKVDKADVEVTGVIKNTRLPAINRQEMNVDYNNATDVGWMWVGNPTTIDDIELQIKSGTITVSNLLDMKSGLTNLIHLYDAGEVTTNEYGVLETTIPKTYTVMCARFGDKFVNMFTSPQRQNWAAFVFDIDSSGNCVKSAGATGYLVVHYIAQNAILDS